MIYKVLVYDEDGNEVHDWEIEEFPAKWLCLTVEEYREEYDGKFTDD